MQVERQLSSFASIIQQKLRALLKGGQPSAQPPLTFVIKSLKPLLVADSSDLTVSCQTDAPRQLGADETVGFDDYQVDLQFSADSQIKQVTLTVKSLLYGINHTRKEKHFNAKFNLTPALAKQSKEIVGCVNRLRKKKMASAYQGRKEDVTDLVTVERAVSEPLTTDEANDRIEPEVELTEEHLKILNKLTKIVNRNQLFRAAMKHTLKDLDARRIVRLMIFPDKDGGSDGLSQPEKKCYSRTVITTLLSEYKK